MKKKIIVLGATGSVGSNALSVIRGHLDEFEVTGLAAGRRSDRLAALASEFPRAAVAVGEEAFGLLDATRADICLAAVSGTAGLRLAFRAAELGMRILLANKEVLVSAGRLFMEAAAAGGSEILPVDSEHTALWQCLDGRDRRTVRRLIITASGGPFREWPAERMALATPADALKHPVWRMGEKITIDSATLANKALEVMEAHHLFGLSYDAIEVLVHPQSAVHGLAEFVDGSVMAHMGVCDMRQPLGHMLFYPERRESDLPRFDLAGLGRLEFFEPDHGRFPLLGIGLEAARRGGRHPAFFNAANEAAVELFLAGKVSFSGLSEAVAAVMDKAVPGEIASLDDVMRAHDAARAAVTDHVAVAL